MSMKDYDKPVEEVFCWQPERFSARPLDIRNLPNMTPNHRVLLTLPAFSDVLRAAGVLKDAMDYEGTRPGYFVMGPLPYLRVQREMRDKDMAKGWAVKKEDEKYTLFDLPVLLKTGDNPSLIALYADDENQLDGFFKSHKTQQTGAWL